MTDAPFSAPGHIRQRVLGQALLLSGAGVTVGVAVALAVTHFLGSLLFEVTPSDPLTLGGAAAALLAVALIAALGPAHRATRIDPVRALRAE